ncbi:MAG: hypothetical protein RBT11_18950 [Desulfobacterales bacterium]|nr:hypothetical protein [Desulfobacterales bacterium]
MPGKKVACALGSHAGRPVDSITTRTPSGVVSNMPVILTGTMSHAPLTQRVPPQTGGKRQHPFSGIIGGGGAPVITATGGREENKDCLRPYRGRARYGLFEDSGRDRTLAITANTMSNAIPARFGSGK